MSIIIFINAVSSSGNFLDFKDDIPELSVPLCESKHHRSLYATYPRAELRRFVLQEDIQTPILPGRVMIKKSNEASFVFVALGRELTKEESDTVIEVMQILGTEQVVNLAPLSLSVKGAESFLSLLAEKIGVVQVDTLAELKSKGV